VLLGRAPWEAAAWATFCEELRNVLALAQPGQSAATYLKFNTEGAAASQGDEKANQHVLINGQVVHLGSIHSVKGRTVDECL
jgi:DNA helicase II / ATP-dependent DNA helicase PcrA